MTQERSLVLVKPDSVQRGAIGDIIGRFERKGLCITGIKMLHASREQAGQHYSVHEGKPFYDRLVGFITSSPLVAMIVEGDQAISVIRNLVGSTDGRKAPPGTIRGDFGCSMAANLVHASDSPESAEHELAVWFPEGSVPWERCDTPWLDVT